MTALRHFVQDEAIYLGADAAAAFERAKSALFGFQFYAPRVTASIPGGRIQEAQEFMQRARFGPLSFKGPVRVVRCWDENGITFWNAGFTYEALPGHVERGVASFGLTLRGNEVRFRIASDSAPAKWFVRLSTPVARRMQAKAVRHAFAQMRRFACAAKT